MGLHNNNNNRPTCSVGRSGSCLRRQRDLAAADPGDGKAAAAAALFDWEGPAGAPGHDSIVRHVLSSWEKGHQPYDKDIKNDEDNDNDMGRRQE